MSVSSEVKYAFSLVESAFNKTVDAGIKVARLVIALKTAGASEAAGGSVNLMSLEKLGLTSLPKTNKEKPVGRVDKVLSR